MEFFSFAPQLVCARLAGVESARAIRLAEREQSDHKLFRYYYMYEKRIKATKLLICRLARQMAQ